MALNVPVGVNIIRVILLVAADFDLLETPLGKHSVRRAEVAARVLVAEAQPRRQRVDLLILVLAPTVDVVHDLDDPIVLVVADRRVAVARDFIVQLGDWCRDRVRVEVAGGRGVLETDRIAVLEEAERAVRVVRGLVPAGHHNPLVVLVLVVVAGHLLLLGADRVGLDVGVQKTSTPAHVFEREFRAIRDIWGWEAKL